MVTVEIAGQRYPIRSGLDERYVAELAAYVDQKMRAASDSAPASDMLGLAVLVCLNIADEFFRERAMPDRVGWYEPPVEMNALDLCVSGEHVERAALRLDHRRIVAGSDDDPGRHREALGDAGDERMLADLGNSAILQYGR